MEQYRHANWVQFRDEVIKLHKGCCARCLRSALLDSVVLQVHHKRYIPGRLPWEYETTDCEALCRGCHAAEHGHIMPRNGWNCIGVSDLGDLVGACELCGTGIRYVYAVEHVAWGALAVGTVCCDHLTQTSEASDYHEEYIRLINARKRFVGSKRWKISQDGSQFIYQDGIRVEVREGNDGFFISMNGTSGKKRFETLVEAKIIIFDLFQSGEAQKFVTSRRTRTLISTPLRSVEEISRRLFGNLR